MVVVIINGNQQVVTEPFDHSYQEFGQILQTYVIGTRVDYAGLQKDKVALDDIVEIFGQASAADLLNWTREQQMSYWINAYNAFTLQAVVNHYPIKRKSLGWFDSTPRNSIRQISGVWNVLRWHAASTTVTLDEIEHKILRVQYDEPLIHFAINCASVSCPPIQKDPFIAELLNHQLTLATRAYLASLFGLKIEGMTLEISKIFDWYGEDFIDGYAHLINTNRPENERAILGFVMKYGPEKALELIQNGYPSIRFLSYDWSLNDTSVP
jgi:hypothetical protein